MHDTYQGRIGTISPAIGPYYITTHIDIDRYGVTGPSFTGIGPTGPYTDGTLQPIKWDMTYTGIQGENFTNQKRGF